MHVSRRLTFKKKTEITSTFKELKNESKKVNINAIKLEDLLGDIKNGAVPDFGLPEMLKFDEEEPGWHNMTALI